MNIRVPDPKNRGSSINLIPLEIEIKEWSSDRLLSKYTDKERADILAEVSFNFMAPD